MEKRKINQKYPFSFHNFVWSGCFRWVSYDKTSYCLSIQHSVEAVWEAQRSSEAEALRTMCAPGVPKFPSLCLLWYKVFSGQVICLLINAWKILLHT